MADEIRTGKRDLVVRVATLELLVSDLVAILWKLDPALMEQLAHEAERDLTLQNSRTIPAAEHMRDRLFSVLQDRKRRLQRRTKGGSGAAKGFEPDARLALSENLS